MGDLLVDTRHSRVDFNFYVPALNFHLSDNYK